MIAKRSAEGGSIINQQEKNLVPEIFDNGNVVIEDSHMVFEDTDQEENQSTCQEQSQSAVVKREMDMSRCDQSTSESHPVYDSDTSATPNRAKEAPTDFAVRQQMTRSGSKRRQESLVQSSSEAPNPKRAKSGYKWKTQEELDELYTP